MSKWGKGISKRCPSVEAKCRSAVCLALASDWGCRSCRSEAAGPVEVRVEALSKSTSTEGAKLPAWPLSRVQKVSPDVPLGGDRTCWTWRGTGPDLGDQGPWVSFTGWVSSGNLRNGAFESISIATASTKTSASRQPETGLEDSIVSKISDTRSGGAYARKTRPHPGGRPLQTSQ